MMTTKTRIEADLLIHGSREPITDGCVVIDGQDIEYAGPARLAPPGGTLVKVPVVMPGLWDAHCHFFGIKTADLGQLVREPSPARALRLAPDARNALMAGFTSVRPTRRRK